jgi:hypothetical protein
MVPMRPLCGPSLRGRAGRERLAGLALEVEILLCRGRTGTADTDNLPAIAVDGQLLSGLVKNGRTVKRVVLSLSRLFSAVWMTKDETVWRRLAQRGNTNRLLNRRKVPSR